MGQGQGSNKEIQDLKYQLSQSQKKLDENLLSAKQFADEKNTYESKLKEYRGWMNKCENNILSSKEKIDQHIKSADLCMKETENLKKELEQKETAFKVKACGLHFANSELEQYKKTYPDFKFGPSSIPSECRPYI